MNFWEVREKIKLVLKLLILNYSFEQIFMKFENETIWKLLNEIE